MEGSPGTNQSRRSSPKKVFHLLARQGQTLRGPAHGSELFVAGERHPRVSMGMDVKDPGRHEFLELVTPDPPVEVIQFKGLHGVGMLWGAEGGG